LGLIKILIAGAGMVGLNLGKCLKLAGHDISFHEVNKGKLYELYLDGWKARDMYEEGYSNRGISINYDAIFICIPTPTENGKQDLTAVKQVAEMLSKIKNLANPKYLFVKSTVLPTTMRKVIYPLFKKSGYMLVSNPEFMAESDPINTILGGPLIFGFGENNNNNDTFLMGLFPSPLFKQDYYTTTWETAELIKYTNNFLLASRISAWNQIKLIADKVKANSQYIAGILSQEPKIGEYGSHHGKAYGGNCLPKDNEALWQFAKKIGIKSTAMILGNKLMNEYMKLHHGENEAKYVW